MTNKKNAIRHAVSATSTRHGALEIKLHAPPPMRSFEGEGLVDPQGQEQVPGRIKGLSHKDLIQNGAPQ